MTNPLCIDLFCGLGGWAEGFLAEGYRVVGFDNAPWLVEHYPGEFVLQDIRTLDGRRLARAYQGMGAFPYPAPPRPRRRKGVPMKRDERIRRILRNVYNCVLEDGHESCVADMEAIFAIIRKNPR